MRGPRFVLIVCACLVQLLIGRAANIPIGSFRECIRCEPRCDGRWTGFFDRDNPSGQGDYELLADLKRENPGQICDTPSAVYAETLNRLSAELTGETVNISPTTGFSCVNDQQSDGRCQDYRVKFCCPAVVSECNGRWTGFFDRDNPSGTGDWEDLNSLRKENPGQICENPSGVYAETLSGVSAALTGETVNMSPTHGFSCVNDQQSDGRCQDYRVKFCCPAVVSECNGRWTGFFDRDDPGNTGDWEDLNSLRRENPGQICEAPSGVYAETLSGVSAALTGETVNLSPTHGFSCVNDQQSDGRCQDYRVKFCCPVVSECNGRWTGFFDRDNPGGTGDWEDLNSLRRENPGQICENPSGVYAETLSGMSAALTGETINISPTHGFSCVNDQQSDGRCQDYRVKFCC